MSMWLAFAMVFLAGPTAFWVLSKQRATRGYLVALWIITFGLMALAFGLANYGINLAIKPRFIGLSVILSFWMAWITMLSLIMLAVRRKANAPGLHRAAFVVGAMATTLPWFGLYTARMVAE
jgi:high-affinity Fe2+/Pb2+ permease